MIYCRYRLSDGQFLCAWPNKPDFDASTEGVQDFLNHERPDLRLHRFDAVSPTKKRLATAPELSAYDDAVADAQAAGQFDQQKALKAIVLYIAQKHGLTPAQARQEIIAIYKGLP